MLGNTKSIELKDVTVLLNSECLCHAKLYPQRHYKVLTLDLSRTGKSLEIELFIACVLVQYEKIGLKLSDNEAFVKLA